MSESGVEKTTRNLLSTEELVSVIPWLRDNRARIERLTLEELSEEIQESLALRCTVANLQNLLRAFKYHWKGDPRTVVSLVGLEARVGLMEGSEESRAGAQRLALEELRAEMEEQSEHLGSIREALSGEGPLAQMERRLKALESRSLDAERHRMQLKDELVIEREVHQGHERMIDQLRADMTNLKSEWEKWNK